MEAGMIEKLPGELNSNVDEHFDVPAMIRLGAWGVGAVIAVVVTIFAANANLGARRAGPAVTAVTKPAPEPKPVFETKPIFEAKAVAEPPRIATAAELIARANEPDAETKRLAEAVRLLTADRDRLATRIAALERNIDDLTGSVSHPLPVAPPAAAAPHPLPNDKPAPLPAITASIPSGPASAPASVPGPPPTRPPSPYSTPAPDFNLQ